MSFPEEPFNLSITEGGGYYPATIHQKLKDDKYEIVRKLGYGPRSSTWLVFDILLDSYFAVKILTVAASSERAKRQELPILKAAAGKSFWEKSAQGDHLCVVMKPLSTSVQDLVQETENKKLQVGVVQRIACTVAKALADLHGSNIMHGGKWLVRIGVLSSLISVSAVKADNIFFTAATETEFLKAILDTEPAPTTVKVKKYTTVRSQPLAQSFKQYKKSTVADWHFILSNFGHGGFIFLKYNYTILIRR